MGMDGEATDAGRSAAPAVDAAALAAASQGFHAAFPHRSAKRTVYVTQAICFLALLAALWWMLSLYPRPTLDLLKVAALALFATLIFVRLLAAAQITPIPLQLATPTQWPIYTVLCPLYREAALAEPLAEALSLLDYPADALDIKFLVESDDPETIEAAQRAAQRHPIEVIVVPAGKPRTKPKALNVGLVFARGAFVTVYDAEDRPHPQQLRAALAAFAADPGLACVQAPLAIDNAEASWIARQFAAEYAIQFSEILPLLSRLDLALPLGGSSNHFRTAALRSVGGWDPYNVSEDRAKFANKLNRFRMHASHIPFVSHS